MPPRQRKNDKKLADAAVSVMSAENTPPMAAGNDATSHSTSTFRVTHPVNTDQSDVSSIASRKRRLTLDLPAFSSIPTRVSNSTPYVAKAGSANSPVSGPFLLTSPDMQMLKISTPELDRLLLQSLFSGRALMTPSTPVSSQNAYSKTADEAKDSYTKGYVDCIHSMQNSVAQYNMNLGSAIPYQFPMTMNVPMGMPFQLVAGTTQLDQNTGGNVGVTSKTQTSSQVATTTTGVLYRPQLPVPLPAHTQPFHTNLPIPVQLFPQLMLPRSPLPNNIPAPADLRINNTSSPNYLVSSPKPDTNYSDSNSITTLKKNTTRNPRKRPLDRSSYSPLSGTSDGQRVPSRTSCSSSNDEIINVDDPLVGLDQDSREKQERKRERNRLAAAKCRQRKMDKIAVLDEQIVRLKEGNEELERKAEKLRKEVEELRMKAISHKRAGCDLKLPEGLERRIAAMEMSSTAAQTDL